MLRHDPGRTALGVHLEGEVLTEGRVAVGAHAPGQEEAVVEPDLSLDEETQKPSATIEYILKKGDQEIRRFRESKSATEGALRQVTLAKLFPLNYLQPGDYSLVLNITDNLANRTVSPVAKFKVQ